jgi:hypothetical protein
LQEWLTGLRASDWPPLAGVPGVWFRLLTQAALGLHAIHEAGLVHGHLQAGHLLLTGEGVLKLCGVGEPSWLAAAAENYEESPAADLQTLGRIAAGWCGPASGKRKGSNTRALPEALQAVLHRLGADEAADAYPSAAALLEALDSTGAEVPPNAEAWDRLLRHVRENAVAEAALRESA